MYYQGHLKAISLLLGSACNLKCGYCLQQDDSPKNNRKADVDEFVKKFTEYVSLNGVSTETVHYWGGEPLLYWARLKKIYTAIAPLFQARMHRITTNGTLIDEDYVEFCNAHEDIFTVVSYHDGRIEDKTWALIGRLKHFSVETLIHHQKPRPSLYREDFFKVCRLTDQTPTMTFDMIKANDGCAERYWLTKEDLDQYFEDIDDCLVMANYGNDLFAKQVIAHFLFRYRKDLGYRSVKPNSCCNPSILSIDLFGNTYNCHHDNSPRNVTGNIFTKTIPVYATPKTPLERFTGTDKCKKCESYASCGGGCFTSNTHEIECLYYQRREEFIKNYGKTCDIPLSNLLRPITT